MSRVLIIHPDAVQRHYLTTFLEPMGVEVVQCSGTAEVSDLLERDESIDAIIVDLDLPGVSGWECCRLLCHTRDAQMAGIPVVCLSSRLSKVEGERIVTFLGGRAFIPLPVDPAALRTCVFEIFEEKKAQVPQFTKDHTATVSGSPSAESEFQAFIRNFDEIVILTDHEGVIKDINTYGSRVLDWPAQEICGHTLVMLEPSIPLDWLSSSQRPLPMRETRFRTRNGTTLDVLVSVYPVSWEGGVRFILIAKTIQELNFLRTECKRLQEHVQQFTELELVGNLAGGIAHDVNNILTAIQGHASLLTHKGSTDSSTHRPAEVIRQAAHRGQELTAQLLGASRRGNDRRSSINVHDTIEEVLALLSGDRIKGVQIIRQYEAHDSWISGNERQLHQIFLNLFVNACDAMPQGGTITISTRSIRQGEQSAERGFPTQKEPCIEIIVKDSGCGIPEELTSAVFQPFFSTKSSGQGTGMGLAIVKEMVEAHGGRISLSSAVNQGTAFHLYFPQGKKVQSDLIHLPTVLGPGHRRVLVVDDDPLVAETTVEILRFFECDPLVAHSGEEAIDLYQKHAEEIGLVVLDLSMPTMSGEDCFRTLQAINPSVKVIFASGLEKNYSVQRLINEGLAGFVQKPFDIEDISLALKHVLSSDGESLDCAVSGFSSATGGRP